MIFRKKENDNSRFNLIKEYIEIAKSQNLEIGITTNYDNELCIILHSPNLKKLSVKKIKNEENEDNHDSSKSKIKKKKKEKV